VRQRVCRNAVPAGWLVCPFQPAVIRHSVRLLTRNCLCVSQSWHLNVAGLVTRRIGQLLRREGLHVNHKRVYRIYHLISLGVKRRRRRKGRATERLPLLCPDAPNLTWSMDFVMDALASGRFRDECLNEHWFSDILHARKIINDWRQDYNESRPHSSLNYQTPFEFVACWRNGKHEEKLTDITN
jgi:transposase InsO family protein